MKINFIHIGFQKTGSTFLQREIFPSTVGLEVLNHIDVKLEQWFYLNFIACDSHKFDGHMFKRKFEEQLGLRGVRDLSRGVFSISEENLAGDIYSGLESKELMDRLYSVFGKTSILIVIRNQIDFFLSAYSNYTVHGGTKSFRDWIVGEETRFGRIIDKVAYSAIVKSYQSKFGHESVFVIQQESLLHGQSSLKDFLSSFGLELPVGLGGRSNTGRNLAANRVLTVLNKLGLQGLRGRTRIAKALGIGLDDRSFVKKILGPKLEMLYADNVDLEKLLNIDLSPLYFD